MLTHFELAAPSHHSTGSPGDIGNRNNREGRSGRDHMFVQHIGSSGTVFVPSLDSRTSYRIKCFNCKKWGHYEDQLPEATVNNTLSNTGHNLA